MNKTDETLSILADIWEEGGIEFNKCNIEKFVNILTQRLCITTIDKLMKKKPNLEKKIKNKLRANKLKTNFEFISDEVFGNHIFIKCKVGPSFWGSEKSLFFLVLKINEDINIITMELDIYFESEKNFVETEKNNIMEGYYDIDFVSILEPLV